MNTHTHTHLLWIVCTRQRQDKKKRERETHPARVLEYEAQGVIDEGGGKLCEMAPKPKADCEPQKKWLAYRQTPKIRIMGATLGLCSAPLWYVP